MPNNDYFNSATIETMHDTPNSKWLRYPKDVIPLWLASPDFLIAPEIKDALITAVQANDLYYNIDNFTRQSMANKIQRVNNLDVTSENILITQGVDPYIWLAVREACSPGEEVILTDPIYGEFQLCESAAKARMAGFKSARQYLVEGERAIAAYEILI